MLTRNEIPLLEYDDERIAVINPEHIERTEGMPRVALMTYLSDALEQVVNETQAETISTLHTICGPIPIYRIPWKGHDIAVINCTIGAPMAAGIMEDLRAKGCERFLSFGGVGVLDKRLPLGHFLLPKRALRDEGTSYHYLPPARFVEGDPHVLASIESTLRREGAAYDVVTTWTTDAFYRETRDKVNLRKEYGCDCVEMEVAAYMAVAQFRSVPYGALLFGGDVLDQEEWDSREWTQLGRHVRLMHMALHCAAELAEMPEKP